MGPDKAVDALEERVRESDDISGADREKLLAFSRQMKLLDSRYGDYRRRDLLRRCTIIAENVGSLADTLTDKAASEDIVLWIKDKYDNEYTKHDYRTAVRVFGGLLTDGPIEEKPDSIAWIPSGTSSNHDPVPDPADMLDWEADVKPMIEATKNLRDAALIAVAWDAGARSGELQNLTVGDVNDHDHGLQIMVDGKRGQRSIALIPSVPYLQQWLHGGSAGHPASDDPEAPLWSKLSAPKEISYRQFRDIFDAAAHRAGVTKTVTPTNFRKSSATFLARQGMNESYINDRQGRKRGSDATAHYVARFGGDGDTQYAQLHGLEVDEEESEPIGPVECPRCEKETPRDEPKCVWCGQALEHSAIESVREDEQELRSAVFRLAKENPQILDDVERARDLMTVFESNPELFAEARKFTEALADE